MFSIFQIVLLLASLISPSWSGVSNLPSLINRQNETWTSFIGKVLFRRAARSKLMRSYMNESVKPCYDYYEYACGNWKNINRAPSVFDENNVFHYVLRRTENHMEELLEDLTHQDVNNVNSEALYKLKSYYESCVLQNFTDGEKSQEKVKLLNSIFGQDVLSSRWKKDDFDWLDAIARMQLYGANALISEGIGRFNGSYAVELQKGSIQLPNLDLTDFLYQTHEILPKLLDSPVVKGYSTLGRNAIASIANFAIDLSNLLLINEHSNTSKLYSVADLSSAVPGINWNQYFSAIFGNSTVSSIMILTNEIDYFNKLHKLVQQSSPETIANYLALHLLEYLQEGRTVSKHLQHRFCSLRSLEDMPLAAYALHMHKTNSTAIVPEILNMTNALKDTFGKTIDQSTWIDDQLKSKIKTKLNVTNFEIGYPDYVTSATTLDRIYRDLIINSNRFDENFLECLAFRIRFMHNKLSQTTDQIDLNLNLMDIKLRHNSIIEKITIPASILVPPIYHHDLPMAFKYGVIGSMIAVSLFKVFGEMMRMEAEEKYLRRMKGCYAARSSNLTFDGNYLVDEADELIVDRDALLVAYRTYQSWLDEHNVLEEKMPGLNLTTNELFFLSYTQSQCADENSSNNLEMVASELFVSKSRINRILSNNEEFLKVYDCINNSLMNTTNTC